MKNILVLTAVFLLLFSCQKSSSINSGPGSGTPPPGDSSVLKAPAGSVITSYHSYNPLTRTAISDTFIYDANTNLVQLVRFDYDTTLSGASMDSLSWAFTIDATTKLPNGYVLTTFAYSEVATETHQLGYNAQGELTKDTLIANSGIIHDTAVNYYSYESNVIICNKYNNQLYDTTTLLNYYGYAYSDTITLTNGNVTSQIEYMQAPQAWQQEYLMLVNPYSGYVNPAYSAGLSATLGAFFVDQQQIDCLSKDLPGYGTSTYTTDQYGRVVKVLFPDGEVMGWRYSE